MQGSFSGQRMVVQQHGTGPVRPQNLQICAQAPGRFKKSGIPQNMQGSGRIILPGQSSTGGEQGGRKVFTPGQHPGFKKYEREGFTPPPPNFRPPPGFMDMGAPKPADMPGEPKELLDRLRTTSGHWHQLAKFLPQLARAGYNTMMIEGETGLHRSEQDIWTVALQVYESLKRSGKVPDAEMAHFNIQQGAQLLYELRFVPLPDRPAAACYMVERDMNAAEALTLGRALKEHARRNGTKEGFANTPQDCMAFKSYRDALETRKPAECQACAEQGLYHATSETAIAKLKALLNAPVEVDDLGSSKLTLMRLTKEEGQYKTVAVAGSLATATAAAIRSCPMSQEFSTFRIFADSGNEKQTWVTLPRWNMLGLADEPCALTIPELKDAPAVARAAGVKGAEQEKLDGPALLVLDRVYDEPEAEQHFLVESDSSLKIVSGSALQSNSVCCGRVLYVCRPPKIERLVTDERMGPVEM